MPWTGSPPNETPLRTTGSQTGANAWANTQAAGRGIESADEDTHDQDIATMIGACLKNDGGNQPTANIPMGGFKLTGLGAPASSADSATKGYVDAAVTAQVNFPVRAASTANVNKSSAVANGSTLDGIVLATNDLILLKNQTTASENGIWVVASSGAPTRASNMNAWANFLGSIVNVSVGTTNAATSWRCSVNSGGTVDSTAVTYVQYGTTLALPVAVANGGTGATDAATAFAAIKQAGTSSATGALQLASVTEAKAGTDTAKAVTAAGVAGAIAQIPGFGPVIIVEEQQASGTNGQDTVFGSDNTRVLNTEVLDTLSICSVGTNQITISAAGTYYFEWSAPAIGGSNSHQSMLYDATGAAVLKRGTSEYNTNGTPQTTTRSSGQHTVTIGSSNKFEIRHRFGASRTGGGGLAGAYGTEIYTVVKIWKTA